LCKRIEKFIETKISFWRSLRAYEEERQMPYITSVEQIGYDRGLEVGVERGEELGAQRQARSIIYLLLEQKFGLIPNPILDRINALSPRKLETLAITLLQFNSIGDIASWLAFLNRLTPSPLSFHRGNFIRANQQDNLIWGG
jgi:Domain of unknown function (DUF4351)